ncbi:MAG TPA: type 4a pilus biogenesis protein PilO [Gemmatimonadales bacterium]|nr:type 4a pilus biogenesis protein PilO [Gemmatimonadales bacterium]
MASLSSQKSTPILVALLAGIVGYIGYTGSVIDNVGLSGLAARKEQVAAVRDTIARLDAATDSAKKELARGTVEDLRKRLDTYRGSLALLRRLVPERNEVPNLLDDISTRGKIRGVTLSQVVPLPVEPGPVPFDTYRYNMSVIGHYDEIGQFLADVASLQRIIVPYDLSVAPAQSTAAKALNDTSGALLEAKFQVRTFVKSPSGEGEASGT